MSLSKYRPYIGIVYEAPHGCFKLVDQIYRGVYGIDLGDLDEGLHDAESRDRTARVRQQLSRLCESTVEPKEGDLAIIKCRPWHIAVVIGEGMMLHAYAGGTSCVEEYTSPRMINRIEGFYRYKGLSE